jgi:hypothetical protein
MAVFAPRLAHYLSAENRSFASALTILCDLIVSLEDSFRPSPDSQSSISPGTVAHMPGQSAGLAGLGRTSGVAPAAASWMSSSRSVTNIATLTPNKTIKKRIAAMKLFLEAVSSVIVDTAQRDGFRMSRDFLVYERLGSLCSALCRGIKAVMTDSQQSPKHLDASYFSSGQYAMQMSKSSLQWAMDLVGTAVAKVHRLPLVQLAYADIIDSLATAGNKRPRSL